MGGIHNEGTELCPGKPRSIPRVSNGEEKWGNGRENPPGRRPGTAGRRPSATGGPGAPRSGLLPEPLSSQPVGGGAACTPFHAEKGSSSRTFWKQRQCPVLGLRTAHRGPDTQKMPQKAAGPGSRCMPSMRAPWGCSLLPWHSGRPRLPGSHVFITVHSTQAPKLASAHSPRKGGWAGHLRDARGDRPSEPCRSPAGGDQ